MAKKIRIKDCNQCQWFKLDDEGYFICGAKEPWHYFNQKENLLYQDKKLLIPSWCPLPDDREEFFYQLLLNILKSHYNGYGYMGRLMESTCKDLNHPKSLDERNCCCGEKNYE